MPLDLDSLVEQLPEQELELFEVDVSEFYPGVNEPVIFVYREPDIPDVFACSSDALKMQAEEPKWTSSLAETVALMALSHVSPVNVKIPTGQLYMRIVKKNGRMFKHLMRKFLEAFPHLKDMDASVEEEKNDSGTAEII